MTDMRKHFVTYLSPGTFVHEEETREIEAWDVERAKEGARSVEARHRATPFAFYFTTRRRGPDEFDSHEVARSGRYFLGGTVETLADVECRATKDDEILLSNMRSNGYARIVTNVNSWRVTVPMQDGDEVLAWP